MTALSDLFFLDFNNYYNRKLKKYDSFYDYTDYIVHTQGTYDFKPNDYIYTQVKINIDGADAPPAVDYMIQCQYNYNTGKQEVISRWWIIEMVRKSRGVFVVDLFRDTLADYLDAIQSAPVFVEKAMLPASSPLLFNKEDMTFNQIRQQPRKLGDITGCPWIVGYIPKDTDLSNKTITASYNTADSADFEVANLEDWTFYNYVNNPGYIVQDNQYYTNYRYMFTNANLDIGYNVSNSRLKVGRGSYSTLEDSSYRISNTVTGTPAAGYSNDNAYKNTYYYTWNGNNNNTNEYNTKKNITTFATNLWANTQYWGFFTSLMKSKYDILSEVQINELRQLEGKTILDTNSGQYYKISLVINDWATEIDLEDPTMISMVEQAKFAPTGGSRQAKTFTLSAEGYALSLNLVQTQTEITAALSNDRYHLEDQPYDMFCIPYGEIKLYETQPGAFECAKIGTSLASAIAEYVGTGAIYDVQLLPYCPVQYLWDDEYNWIDLSKTKYSIIKDENDKRVSALIWCRYSNFTFDLDLYIPDKTTAIEKKIASETELYRLVSPNGNGIFEFNPYKNGGLDFLRVDCSYKPFNPYIRLAPVFKGLYGYGGQYDYRGLILGGDFSITQLSDAWANYELQNKNYQAMFDRQIQHMEVNNKYQKIGDIAGALTGSVSAGVSGAMIGSMIGTSGGIGGTVAGAAVGAAAGVGTGIYDVVAKEKLRNETLDYTKDNFGYELGNIQAIPTSITKTTALNINNSFIPMLETYKCTDVEKEAFRNKLEYNGMTVMAIGTMSDYSEGYFKGKLIRLEGISDDYHVANIIASELNKGVYLT